MRLAHPLVIAEGGSIPLYWVAELIAFSKQPGLVIGSQHRIAILNATLQSFKTDKDMQADLARLDKACCEPQRFVNLQGAPMPVDV